ncbi:uncharacterized protein LOC121587944 [Anopheles merus]|uniref:uncharacterized protein LOC121587944 n=1 Tax=Anopheles merus TaxID=30066 RepID=UPI001BE4A514|nr:uncharacterized protein LOC121587944 [Anopheles merus]
MVCIQSNAFYASCKGNCINNGHPLSDYSNRITEFDEYPSEDWLKQRNDGKELAIIIIIIKPFNITPRDFRHKNTYSCGSKFSNRLLLDTIGLLSNRLLLRQII